jgi:protein-S-isoprenylcysteine O-methyltransferase Ste14
MPLIEEMEATGHWLFRWRGYLPLTLVVLFVIGLKDFTYPFGSHRSAQAWELLCFAVSLLGLIVRIVTVAFTPMRTSGRNRREQVADTLNTTGMYSIVRNPLYLGNFLVGLGVSLFLGVWWTPVIYTLVFMLYYERIIFAEELFLTRKFGQLYTNWAANTPMLLPRIRQWQPTALRINRKKIIRQEHQTMFGIVVVFYILDLVCDWRLGRAPFSDIMWNAIAAVSLILFIVARYLYKRTNLLKDRESESANKPMK